ncbi:MAG TPA: ABC transporter ATP-binding protein [Candidatus Saccharimonadales bacterium]|nr:ABC transporter ATP-binding protein [Candidatus Saccharimonadales bacterium]
MTTNSEPIITVQNVSKTFQIYGRAGETVLSEVNFDIRRSEFLTLIGPSGCGKSTLLRLLAGLDRKFTGTITRSPGLKISLVFQNFALFSWLTVEENIGFGLRMNGQNEGLIKKRVAEEMKLVGLEGFGNKHPKELSGGMKQRVGLARAMVMDPDVLYMDEPFSALDAFTAKTLRADLLKIWQQRRMTIVLVTHLVDEAVELSDRVVVFSARPGTVKEVIVNDLPRPRQLREQKFYTLADRLENLVVTNN